MVSVEGIGTAQEIFGGVPQEGDGSAPQTPRSRSRSSPTSSAGAAGRIPGTIPELVENYARPGDVKLLLRHYSVAENPLELGFFGAEAAAEQGYGWQYTYLFFRNQDEAERFGVDDDFMDPWPARSANWKCPSGRNTWNEKRRRRGDQREARRVRRARHRPRHPHQAGDDRQRPEGPAPCRTGPPWGRSNARSPRSGILNPRCGRGSRPHLELTWQG